MSLYQDHILDHSRNPRHFGTLEEPSVRVEVKNPTCGDQLSLDLAVRDDRIEAIAFTGAGCAISLASASLLSEHVSGMETVRARALTPEDVLALLGVPLSPARLKCGILSLEALKKALSNL
jgi:nitrogen fixation NifU-like protein